MTREGVLELMSDRQKNHVLILLGIVTSVLTIGGTMMQVGSLKGELVTRVNEHEKRLEKSEVRMTLGEGRRGVNEARLGEHEARLVRAAEDVAEINKKLQGIATRQGLLPGQVVEKLRAAGGEEAEMSTR